MEVTVAGAGADVLIPHQLRDRVLPFVVPFPCIAARIFRELRESGAAMRASVSMMEDRRE